MKLYYRKYGNSGPPIVIVHGLYGSSDNWISIARALEKEHEVFLIDQRNHGLSPHSNEHSYKSMKEDLLEFLIDHALNKVILLGHSMGGKTVMQLSLENPELINSLIIVDIAPLNYKDLALNSHIAANHAKMLDAMLELDLKNIFSRAEASNALQQTIGSERIRMFLLKNLSRNEKKEFTWKINVKVLRENLDEIMAGLPIEEIVNNGGISGFPVLFIRGENSDYIQLKDYPLIKSLYPAAEIISIPDSGHWVHAEQPELLVKNIRYFLSDGY